jgi:hypothetical protein
MGQALDWQQSKEMWMRLLKESTGEEVESWNKRIARETSADEQSRRAWFNQQGVTGYA